MTKKIETERYSSKKVPWIEHTCLKVIRSAAHDAIQQWADSQKPLITEEFLRQLSQKKTSATVVKAMADGLSQAAASQWKFSVELKGN